MNKTPASENKMVVSVIFFLRSSRVITLRMKVRKSITDLTSYYQKKNPKPTERERKAVAIKFFSCNIPRPDVRIASSFPRSVVHVDQSEIDNL